MQILIKYSNSYWRTKAHEFRQSASNAAARGWSDSALWLLNESMKFDHYADQNGEPQLTDDPIESASQSFERYEREGEESIENARSEGRY